MRRWTWPRVAVPLGALVVVILDQLTKRWVRINMPVNVSWQPVRWLDPVFTFTHTHNTGAAFGLFGGMNSVFIVLALVVVAAILVMYRYLAAESRLLRLALALQLGGATGNLIDRITVGHVTDFVNLRWWPVFNVADACLVVGTVVLAVYALFFDETETAQRVGANGQDAMAPPDKERSDGSDAPAPSR